MFARRVVNTLKFFNSLFALLSGLLSRVIPVVERIASELDRFNGHSPVGA